jgi:hypothetical protein
MHPEYSAGAVFAYHLVPIHPAANPFRILQSID